MDASNSVSGENAARHATSPSHSARTPLPCGEMAPMPVMTMSMHDFPFAMRPNYLFTQNCKGAITIDRGNRCFLVFRKRARAFSFFHQPFHTHLSLIHCGSAN